jgi:hypothetical protein
MSENNNIQHILRPDFSVRVSCLYSNSDSLASYPCVPREMRFGWGNRSAIAYCPGPKDNSTSNMTRMSVSRSRAASTPPIGSWTVSHATPTTPNAMITATGVKYPITSNNAATTSKIPTTGARIPGNPHSTNCSAAAAGLRSFGTPCHSNSNASSNRTANNTTSVYFWSRGSVPRKAG